MGIRHAGRASRIWLAIASGTAAIVVPLASAGPLPVFAAGKPASPTAAAKPGSTLATPAPAKAQRLAGYKAASAALPVAFEPNVGQTDHQVDYLARGAGYTIFLSHGAITLRLDKRTAANSSAKSSSTEQFAGVLRLTALGGSAAPGVSVSNLLPGVVNYFTGKDPRAWHRGVPTYGTITYHDIYPGIDLVIYGQGGQLEYDLAARPGADLSAVQLKAQGADRINSDTKGNLTLHVGNVSLTQRSPGISQTAKGGKQTAILGGYRITGKDTFGFVLGPHDGSQTVTVDPVIEFSTLVGGLGTDVPDGLALDSSGDPVIAGLTSSTDYPLTAGAMQPANPSEIYDVSKQFSPSVNPDGVWSYGYSASVGGQFNPLTIHATQSDPSNGACCLNLWEFQSGAQGSPQTVPAVFNNPTTSTINPAGTNPIPAGTTALHPGPAQSDVSSTIQDFPDAIVRWTAPAAGSYNLSATFTGLDDARTQTVNGQTVTGTTTGVYILQNGNAIYSGQVLGYQATAAFSGSVALHAGDIIDFVVDRGTDGNYFDDSTGLAANIVGSTPATGFVTKLSKDGSSLLYSTYLGGSGIDWANGVAADAAGNAYVTGRTGSVDFPVTAGALQPAYGGGITDAFATKLDPSGNLIYSTYLGGSQQDLANGIAVDGSGDAYIGGQTASPDYPTTNNGLPNGAEAGFPGHGFVTEINPSGTTRLYSTYIAGSLTDTVSAIAVDRGGSAYITGQTNSPGLATSGAAQGTEGGGLDAYVAKIASGGPGLNNPPWSYFTYLGGSSDDFGSGIAVDAGGNAYVTGQTQSTNFPVANPAQATLKGPLDAFVTEVLSTGAATGFVYSTYLGGGANDAGTAITVDGHGDAFVVGVTASTDFPTANPIQAVVGVGNFDAFASEIGPGGRGGLLFSTHLGDSAADRANAVAIGPDSGLWVSGYTADVQPPFPTTPNAFQQQLHCVPNVGCQVDGFVTKIVQSAPQARANYAIAYDSGRDVTVMFGGYNGSAPFGSNFLNDTWEWNGSGWVQVVTAHSPFPRYDASMVYSAAEKRMILFGGWVPCGTAIICPAGDTWAYDGNDWVPLNPGVAPPARAAFGMTYDSGRRKVVVFGGSGINGVLLDDTWEWNGSTWAETVPGSPAVSSPTLTGCISASLPDPRAYFSMAFDSVRARTVLFSGTTGICDFAETWEYDGSGWRNVTPANGNPSPRGNYAMAYSPASERTVLTGGCLAGTIFNDTWAWDGTSWTDQSRLYGTSGGRFNIAAAYDAGHRKLVGFGGNNGNACAPVTGPPLADTWQLSFPGEANPPPPPPPTAASKLSLTVDESVIPAGTAVAPLAAVPAGRVPQILNAPASSPVGSIPVGSIPVGSIPVGSIPVGSIPVGSIPVGSIPVGSIDINSSPVGSIPVGSIGLDASGTSPLANVLLSALPAIDWSSVLGGTSLAGLPLQTLTLKDVQAQAAAPGQASSPWEKFGALALANTGIANTLLRGTTLASILLGGAKLSQLTTIPDGQPTWCDEFKYRSPGFTRDSNNASTTFFDGSTTMLGQDIAGAPVGSIPVGSIPVGSIPVGSIPVGSIPVGSISNVSSVVDCGRIDCSLSGGKKLADAASLSPSAILPGVTLAQLIAGLVPLSSLNWEKLSVDGFQDFAPVTQAGLHYHVNVDLDCSATKSLAIRVNLPVGFRYIANSSQVTFGSGTAQALAEPGGANAPLTDAPDVLTWNAFPARACTGQTSGTQHVALNFRAQPGLDVGNFASAATVSTPGSLTASNQAPVDVTENFEPSGTPATAPIIQPDQLVLSQIATEGNTDYFRLPIPTPGSRITVYLSHIAEGSDFDLVIGKPATGSLLSSPVGSIPVGSIPIEDRGLATNNATSSLPPETLQDVSLNGVPVGSIPAGGTGGLTVASVSANRGNADEVATFVTGTETGFYTIQVTGYNGSTSSRPYVLRVRESAPITLNCPAVSLPTTGTVGTLPSPTGLSTSTTTLFLINQSRMANLYNQADVDSLLSNLRTLSGRPDVKGAIIPVDGSASVRAAYNAWDQAPCDIGKANRVVAAINAVVATYRAALHNLRYIVLVGSDQAIPMARAADLTTISNESNEARDLAFLTQGGTQAGALVAAETLGFYLTDNAYVTFSGTSWLGSDLYLPTISSGRLIETPKEIIGQINQYTIAGGILTPSTAFTSGYDFLASGATDIATAMANRFGSTNSDGHLISSIWNATDIKNAFFNASPAGIDSPNAHYSHYLMEPAAAARNTGFTQSDLVSTQAVANLPQFSMAGRIIFTMGCHGGLNVPDTLLSGATTAAQQQQLLDWAQAYSQQHVAVYVANTGYGYGDTTTTALSVLLMDDFGQELATMDGRSIGEKLVTADHTYYQNMGAYGVYDKKALEEATFYGFPQYHLSNGGTTPSPTFVATNGHDSSTGLPTYGVAISNLVTSGRLIRTDTGFGSYYSGPDGTQATFYRPIQPLKTQDVTASATTGTAHGVFITGLSTNDVSPFTPALARPTIDLTAHEPQPNYNDNLFPANFVRLDRSNAFGSDRQRFVLTAGQYRPNPNPTTGGIERLVNSINANVIYSTSTNFVPPLISLVNAVNTGNGSANVSVEVSDGAGVARVTALVLDDMGWHRVDLTRNGSTNLWTGTATGLTLAAGDNPEVFAEAEDGAGNVGYSTGKGFLFQAISSGSDTIAPTTTATPVTPFGSITLSSVTLTPQGGQPQSFGPLTCWAASKPTVALQATDNAGGSGVKQLSYSLSGAQTTSTTTVVGSGASPAFTANGMTRLSYFATDFAGNVEQTTQVNVFVANPIACMPAFTITSFPAHGTLAVSGSVTIVSSSGTSTTPFSFTITF